MLIDYIRHHEFDFVFLQELADPDTVHVTGYDIYLNIGANMRGTAILARHDFPLNDVTRLPSGRALAAEYNGTRFINVYSPSGSAKGTDREGFFNLELPELLYATLTSLLIGGVQLCASAC
jgi:exonuclease III